MSLDRREFLRATASVAVAPVLASTVLATQAVGEASPDVTAEMLHACLAGNNAARQHLRACFQKRVEDHLRGYGSYVPPRMVSIAQFAKELALEPGKRTCFTTILPRLCLSCDNEFRDGAAPCTLGKRLLDFYHGAAASVAATVASVPPQRFICMRKPNLWIEREEDMVDAFAWFELLCYPPS